MKVNGFFLLASFLFAPVFSFSQSPCPEYASTFDLNSPLLLEANVVEAIGNGEEEDICLDVNFPYVSSYMNMNFLIYTEYNYERVRTVPLNNPEEIFGTQLRHFQHEGLFLFQLDACEQNVCEQMDVQLFSAEQNFAFGYDESATVSVVDVPNATGEFTIRWDAGDYSPTTSATITPTQNTPVTATVIDEKGCEGFRNPCHLCV